MYPLGNYMNKRNVFFAFLWLFLCLHAMYLEKSPVDFLREVFAVCPVPITRSETWTKTVDMFIRSVTKRYAFYTAIYGITGSEIECRFQWCKRRGRLQTSLVAKRIIVGNSQKKSILNHKTPSNVSNIPHKMKLNLYPFDWGMGLMDWWPVGLSQANKRPQ